MKRILSIFIVLVMIFSMVGCGNNTDTLDETDSKSQKTTQIENKDNEDDDQDSKDSEEGDEKAEINFDDKYEINVFQWGPRDIASGDEVIKHLNEKLNIDLKIQRVLAKEYVQNIEIKIAGNDIPDLFRLQDEAKHIYNNLYKDDYLANFTEYADRYDLVNLKSWFNEKGVEDYAEEDGFYRLPTRNMPPGAISNIIVRRDWMNQVKLENPKDYDEFKTLLKAFKDNKLGGENTIPLTGAGLDHALIAGFYGANGWKNVDGKWVDVRVLPGFKKGIQYLNELYSEGLIDKEIFTLNETQSRGKFINGNVGMVIPSGGMFDRFIQYEDLFKENNPDGEITTVDPLPEGPEGIVYLGSTGLYSSAYIPKQDKSEDYISRVMALMDYIYSDEGKDILVYGIEGIHYERDNDNKVTTEAYERDIIPGIGHLFSMFTDYSLGKLNVHDVVDNSFEIGTKYAHYNPVPNSYVNEIVNEYSPIINDVYEEWWVDFITGIKDVDSDWDEYIKAMNKAGLDKVTEEINKYLSQKDKVS